MLAEAAATAVAAGEPHGRTRFDPQGGPALDGDVPVYRHPPRPGGVRGDVAGQGLADKNVEHHTASADGSDILQREAHAQVAAAPRVHPGSRITVRGKTREPHAVERIARIPLVAAVFGCVRRVFGPVVEVVTAAHGIGDGAREALVRV